MPRLSFLYDELADTQAVRKARPRRGKKSIDVESRFRRIGQPAAYKFRRRLVVRQSHRIVARDLGDGPTPLHDDHRLSLPYFGQKAAQSVPGLADTGFDHAGSIARLRQRSHPGDPGRGTAQTDGRTEAGLDAGVTGRYGHCWVYG